MRDRPDTPHRLELELKLGRKLRPNEVAHHLDENKVNQSRPNLEAVDRATHTANHNKSRHLSRLRKALRHIATRNPRT